MVQTYTGDYVWWHQYKLMNKQVQAERRQGGILGWIFLQMGVCGKSASAKE